MQKTTGQLLIYWSDFSASGEYYFSHKIHPVLSEEQNDGARMGSNATQSAAEGDILSVAFKVWSNVFERVIELASQHQVYYSCMWEVSNFWRTHLNNLLPFSCLHWLKTSWQVCILVIKLRANWLNCGSVDFNVLFLVCVFFFCLLVFGGSGFMSFFFFFFFLRGGWRTPKIYHFSSKLFHFPFEFIPGSGNSWHEYWIFRFFTNFFYVAFGIT